MRNPLHPHLLLLAAALCAIPAKADVNIRGASSCETWISERASGLTTAASHEKSWLLGFQSGLATATGIDFWGRAEVNRLDNDWVFTWVDNYCKANPQRDIDDAAVALFSERRKALRK
jgi:hypothetical protein